jgi:hypothetical protein
MGVLPINHPASIGKARKNETTERKDLVAIVLCLINTKILGRGAYGKQYISHFRLNAIALTLERNLQNGCFAEGEGK